MKISDVLKLFKDSLEDKTNKKMADLERKLNDYKQRLRNQEKSFILMNETADQMAQPDRLGSKYTQGTAVVLDQSEVTRAGLSPQ